MKHYSGNSSISRVKIEILRSVAPSLNTYFVYDKTLKLVVRELLTRLNESVDGATAGDAPAKQLADCYSDFGLPIMRCVLENLYLVYNTDKLSERLKGGGKGIIFQVVKEFARYESAILAEIDRFMNSSHDSTGLFCRLIIYEIGKKPNQLSKILGFNTLSFEFKRFVVWHGVRVINSVQSKKNARNRTDQPHVLQKPVDRDFFLESVATFIVEIANLKNFGSDDFDIILKTFSRAGFFGFRQLVPHLIHNSFHHQRRLIAKYFSKQLFIWAKGQESLDARLIPFFIDVLYEQEASARLKSDVYFEILKGVYGHREDSMQRVKKALRDRIKKDRSLLGAFRHNLKTDIEVWLGIRRYSQNRSPQLGIPISVLSPTISFLVCQRKLELIPSKNLFHKGSVKYFNQFDVILVSEADLSYLLEYIHRNASHEFCQSFIQGLLRGFAKIDESFQNCLIVSSLFTDRISRVEMAKLLDDNPNISKPNRELIDSYLQ